MSSIRPLPKAHITTLPVAANPGAEFVVRRVWCVGQNYVSHAAEMGQPHDSSRKEPHYFMKPSDAITTQSTLPYPPRTSDFQHEVELVIAIGLGGRDIPVSDVGRHIFGFAVGVDLTRRDLQRIAKAKGRPFEMGKSFDLSAPCSPILPLPPTSGSFTDVLPPSAVICLTVNGVVRQRDAISSMIWGIEELVSILSTYVELAPGDLVFAGTPAGVGVLRPGDVVEATVTGVPPLKFTVGPPRTTSSTSSARSKL